jgi:hypothetical protein
LKKPNNFSIQKAHNTQTLLAQKIAKEDRLLTKIRFVDDEDVAYVGNFGVGMARQRLIMIH